jgi:hypothetical protein
MSVGRGGRLQARVGRHIYTYLGALAVLQIAHPAVIYARWHSRCPRCGQDYVFVTKRLTPRLHGCWSRRPDRGEAA